MEKKQTMISLRLKNTQLLQLKQMAKASGVTVTKLLLTKTLNTNA
jgi:predicted DNA binding CopG/RHH family protein